MKTDNCHFLPSFCEFLPMPYCHFLQSFCSPAVRTLMMCSQSVVLPLAGIDWA